MNLSKFSKCNIIFSEDAAVGLLISNLLLFFSQETLVGLAKIVHLAPHWEGLMTPRKSCE